MRFFGLQYICVLATFAFALACQAEARQVQPSTFGGSPKAAQSITADGRIVQACKGCGCRGGAGYRLSNGKCAPRGR